MGETAKNCLAREILEEFGVEIEVGRLLTQVEYSYGGGKNFRLHTYLCKVKKGEIKSLEHEDIAWVLPEQLDNYDLLAADKEIVDLLIKTKKIYKLATN